MDEEIDLATGSFVKKWPVWLRWTLFLPSAIIGSLLAVVLIGVMNWISMLWVGANDHGLWYQIFQLAQSFMLGLFFVLFGATVVPKGQFATSIILMIVFTIFMVLVYLLTLSNESQSQSPLMTLLSDLLAIAGGGYAIFLAHKGEPWASN